MRRCNSLAKIRTLTAALVLLGPVALGGSARAQTPALTILSPDIEFDHLPRYSLGWEFATSASVTVSALGYFTERPGENTLISDHTVSIYTNGGQTKLVSTVVSHDTTSFVSGYFVYANVAPVTLPAGDYVITGSSGEDTYELWGEIATDARVTFIQDRYNTGGNNDDYPMETHDEIGFFGPSFAIAAAPEPSPFAVLGMGCLVLGGSAVRARRVRRRTV